MTFEPVTIKLFTPLTHGEERISELTFAREMEAGDLFGTRVGGLDHEDLCRVAGRLTGVPLPVLKKMKMRDYRRVSGVIEGFFDNSPPTGGTE